MDVIMSMMNIVRMLVDLRANDPNSDSFERQAIGVLIATFETIIEHKTERLGEGVKSPEDFKEVMYQLLMPPTVDGIWVELPPEEDMPGGFSTN